MSMAIGKKIKEFVQYNERIILGMVETKPKDTIIVKGDENLIIIW